MTAKLANWMVAALFYCAFAGSAQAASVVLNDLQIEIDDQTGTLTRVTHPATGVILEASRENSGILTVSSPSKSFYALQLEPRLSRASIVRSKEALTVSWTMLQANRRVAETAGGGVQAEVSFRAASDKRSIIVSARVHNRSQADVSQILFPDLRGLRPFDDPERMELRMALGTVNPFAGEVRREGRATFYPHLMWREYPAGAQYDRNALRWMDYGSLKAGVSVFEKKWLVEPRPGILTHRNEADPNDLRVAWQHKVHLRPGESWDSGEYWITPHRGGWAKGIETYREYARRENKRLIAAPNRVRDGLGFQTVWMIQSSESDPAYAAFRFSDIPRIARDAMEHGIDELVLWGWCTYGQLPIRPRPELGTEEDLLKAIRDAKQLGVNVTLFVNLKNLDNRYADRYGLKPGSGAAWIYSPEAIPAMLPFTAASGQIDVPTDNAVWARDASEALLEWVRRGATSFAFDVYDDVGKMALIDWTNSLRAEVRKVDPEAIFAGEPVNGSFERAALSLDYTWNWMDYIDAGAYQNAIKYPRINVNAESSGRVVKMAFADGLYINAMPKRPNLPNGTKLISEEPELSAALKEVAPLRRQFLEFFRDGTFLGDSVLSRPVTDFVRKNSGSWIGGATIDVGDFEYPDVLVSGHQLADRLLIVVLNNGNVERSVDVTSDLSLWLPRSTSYEVVQYDGAGKAQPATQWSSTQWSGKASKLPPLGFAFFEISIQR